MKSLNVFTIEVDFTLAVKCLVKSVRNLPIEHGHEKNDFFSNLELNFFGYLLNSAVCKAQFRGSDSTTSVCLSNVVL